MELSARYCVTNSSYDTLSREPPSSSSHILSEGESYRPAAKHLGCCKTLTYRQRLPFNSQKETEGEIPGTRA